MMVGVVLGIMHREVNIKTWVNFIMIVVRKSFFYSIL